MVRCARESLRLSNGSWMLVLPHMEDENDRERTKDELPQSASGRTIMTTEPKFVPKEAAEVKLMGDIPVKVRLIDCVGYMAEGAVGQWKEMRSGW